MSDITVTTGKENPVVRTGAFFSALLMLTVPFSTTVAIAMTFLVFACWVLSSQARTLPLLIRNNPVAASALLFYGLLLVGTSYGTASIEDSWSMLRKYREFPLVVILLPFMQEEKYRCWIIAAFIVASIVTLVGSYLMDFGVLPLDSQNTATFKSRITHNLFMAFFAYCCAYQASIAASRRWPWIGLCVAAAFNLFVVVQGRTGQVIFILLMSLLVFQRLNTKRALILAPLMLICVIGALSVSGTALRFQEGIENSSEYLQGRANLGTSMGQRLYFWQNSINLIRKSPVVGYGTGSFAAEFSRITGGGDLLTENPHNEYLMISVQLGLTGLVAYLYFLACQIYYSFYLPEDRRWFAQAVCLSLAVNSLLNTTFLDHTEGHWYATLIALSFAALPSNRARGVKTKS